MEAHTVIQMLDMKFDTSFSYSGVNLLAAIACEMVGRGGMATGRGFLERFL